MMTLPKILLMTAALVAANVSFAQTAVTGVKATVDVPAVSVGATTGATVSVPATLPPAAVKSTVSTSASTSADPYVQKREADSVAKKEYKMRKKMAKEEYKKEKAEAKSEMKSEKRESSGERRAELEADKKSGTAKVIGN